MRGGEAGERLEGGEDRAGDAGKMVVPVRGLGRGEVMAGCVLDCFVGIAMGDLPEIAETRGRVLHSRREGADLLGLGGVLGVAELLMAIEVSGRVDVIFAVDMFAGMAEEESVQMYTLYIGRFECSLHVFSTAASQCAVGQTAHGKRRWRIRAKNTQSQRTHVLQTKRWTISPLTVPTMIGFLK